jgi:hypothetical protein
VAVKNTITGQKTYGAGAHKMSAAIALPIFQINQGQFTERVRTALVLHFSRERNAHKRLAERADVNVGTAKNWLEGRSVPQGLHLLRLMATVPELQAEVRRLCAMEADCDPELEREIHDLFRVWQRRHEERA